MKQRKAEFVAETFQTSLTEITHLTKQELK